MSKTSWRVSYAQGKSLMKISKTETKEEIEHQSKIATTLRKRLRVLELQMAQQGISTPPQILTEIAVMTEQINQRESEIARLESIAAENELSLAEAEYRMMLAEVWNASNGGWPHLTATTRLEFQRLKLGLLPERAQQLEDEVRVILAEDALVRLDPEITRWIPFTPRNDNFSRNESWTSMLAIGRAIRCSLSTTLHLFPMIMDKFQSPLDYDHFQSYLLRSNRVWRNRAEYVIFDQLLSVVRNYTTSDSYKE
jgi:hypothetical protein